MMLSPSNQVDIRFDQSLRSISTARHSSALPALSRYRNPGYRTRRNTRPYSARRQILRIRGFRAASAAIGDGRSSDAANARHVPDSLSRRKCRTCVRYSRVNTMELAKVETYVWHLGRHYNKVPQSHAYQPIRMPAREFPRGCAADEAIPGASRRPASAFELAARQSRRTALGIPVHVLVRLPRNGRRILEENPEVAGQLFKEWWAPDTRIGAFILITTAPSVHAVDYCAQSATQSGTTTGRTDSSPTGPEAGWR